MKESSPSIFGNPPPRYPATVTAVRIAGVEVSGDDAKGSPDLMGFDIAVRTDGPDHVIENIKSHSVPPAGGVDVDASNIVGHVVDVWWIANEGALLAMIPLPADSVDCESIGGA